MRDPACGTLPAAAQEHNCSPLPRYTQRKRLCLLFGPTQPTLLFLFFLQTDLVRYRALRRRTTNLVVPILEAPTHTLSE